MQVQEKETDMNSRLHSVLQILLWVICAFNVTIGLGLNIFGHNCLAVGTASLITGTP